MSEQLHPSAGARYLLERIGDPGDRRSADYRATVFTPTAAHAYQLALSIDEPPALRADAAPAEPALEATLLALAKSVARAAGRRRTDGLEPWPHRILRWRGPGRGT